MRLLFLIIFSTFFIHPAMAACTNPDGVPGELMYNGNYDVFQGCTTRGWKAFHPPKQPPEGCPNIGDICTGKNAGMVYAGEYRYHRLYIAADDAPTGLTWGPRPTISGMGFCRNEPLTNPPCEDGLTNTQILQAHEITFPAAEYCANLSAHGYGIGQWYLPSRGELDIIYQRLKAGKPSGTHNLLDSDYWSSTEYSSHAAWVQRLDPSGHQHYPSKDNVYRVRCVTR